jgi:Uma2 family endonuclease
MTSILSTDSLNQQVADECVTLNLENVGLSDEQFIELCADNPELHIELTARKALVIMSPPGPKTGRRNAKITTDLEIWSRLDGTGITFSPLTVFALPNGARRAPDASWMKREQWDAVSNEEQDKLPTLCPDFVIELASSSDRRPYRFRMLQAKMEEYLENGARLGWLIDPYRKTVHVYRSGAPVEKIENAETISGEAVLPGFQLDLGELWD